MYRILLQKNKKALGVLPYIFESTSEINDFMDRYFDGYFYSTDFAGSEKVKTWLSEFGEYKGLVVK